MSDEYTHLPDCKMKFAPLDVCGCEVNKVEQQLKERDALLVIKTTTIQNLHTVITERDALLDECEPFIEALHHDDGKVLLTKIKDRNKP